MESIIHLLFILISMAFGFCIAVILHELGHLVCGYLSGYRFVSFRLIKWLWTKDQTGRIKLTKSAGLGIVLGQCLMEPPDEYNPQNFRFVLYNLGGGLCNVMTGIMLFIPLFFIDIQWDEKVLWTESFLLAVGFCSVLIGALNLIPSKRGGIPNDGSNIKEALKSADAKRGLYIMLKVNAEMSKGKRLLDYDESAFAVSGDTDKNNYLVANIILLHASQLEEKGDYGRSYREFFRLNPANLPSFFSSQLTLCIMFQELVFFGDEASKARARQRIEAKANDKLFQNLLKMKHPAFLPFYAAKKAFLDNDVQKARELIAKARKLNGSLQNPGQEHSITLMLDRLESRLDSGEVPHVHNP